MAAQYPPPPPMQVGSYFVGQYYHVLQQQPDLVHQFYSDASSMIRVDGDSDESASSMLDIHSLIMSLNFTAIEIKSINSLGSWNGGVLVMVSGSVKTKEFSGRRKFVQTFFLAPQEKGYFVLNDIFQFLDEELIYQHPQPVLSENKFDVRLDASSPLPEQPDLAASDYSLEEEAREYVTSVHIEDDPIDKYSLPEQEEEEEPEPEPEPEVVVEVTPAAEAPASFQTDANPVQPPAVTAVEEPVDEPQIKTYASILRVSKSQNASLITTQPSFTKTASTTSDWNPTPQQSNYASSYVTEYAVSSYVPESGFEAADESLAQDEGEVKSVYVRNLPSTVTAFEIEQEFQNFGRIKPDGVFVRNRKDVVGVCYAFVEFEDISGVQNAIQASPILLAGRQVYIEERRPNSGSTSRGGSACLNPLVFLSFSEADIIFREGEEAGEVTKQSLLVDALVVVVWAGEVRKMVVTITDQEAMVSNVVHNETIIFRRPSMNRRNHSRGSYFFDLTVLLIPGGTFLLF